MYYLNIYLSFVLLTKILRHMLTSISDSVCCTFCIQKLVIFSRMPLIIIIIIIITIIITIMIILYFTRVTLNSYRTDQHVSLYTLRLNIFLQQRSTNYYKQ